MPSNKKAPTSLASRQAKNASENLGWDAWLAILSALPLFVIAMLPVLLDVPTTESAGPGFVLGLLLPAGLLLVLGPNAKRLGWPHLVLLALALVVLARSFFELDSFEARRCSVVWSTSALCFALGGGIDKRGRRFFLAMLAWLIVACAIGWLVALNLSNRSLAESFSDWNQLQFGNRGDLAEFLVPAMAFAVAGFLRSHHLVMGSILLASATIVAAFLGWTPVNAGVLALFVMTAAGLLGGIRSSSSARVGRLLLLTSLVCALAMGLRAWQDSATNSDEPGFEAAAPADNSVRQDRIQGLEVRLSIWKSTLAMSQSHLLAGVGPGQFRQAFPPYRSTDEIESSSHGNRFRNAIEVEHAHNDYLTAIAELGWPLGLLWIGLCLWILRKALGNLIEQDRTRVVPSIAAVGVLVLAFWNAPLLGPVVSHPLAWLCFGMAMGPMPKPRSPKFGIAVAASCLVLAVSGTWSGWQFLRHGLALAHGPNDSAALQSALEFAPDSTLALDFAIHAVPPPKLAGEPTKAWLAKLRPQFQSLLEKRPYAVGLQNDWGRALAMAGEYQEADRAFAAALSLDPHFTPAHSNRVRKDVDMGDLESLRVHLKAAVAAGAFEKGYVRSWGLFCLRNGRPEIAQVLLRMDDEALTVTDANVCHQQAQLARLASNSAEENSFLAGEHLLFARDHIAVGSYESAVRSYRQAKRYAQRATSAESDPPALRLEMAAALILADLQEESIQELAGLNWPELTPLERNGLPKWARDVLPALPK